MSCQAQHQDRLAKAHEVAGHLFAHHRDLVEHYQLGVGGIALRVESEARLLHLRDDLAHCFDSGFGCGALESAEQPSILLGFLDRLFRGLDLLFGRLDDAVDQTVDGPRRRPLAAQDQGGLAGEGRGDHAGHAGAAVAIALMRIKTQLVERELEDRRFSGSRITKQPKNLAVARTVLEPVLDGSDGAGLGIGGREAAHDRVLQQRSCHGHGALPGAGALAALADGRASVISGARQQFLAFARHDDLDGPIAHVLCKRGIERDQLAIELPGVAIERSEQRRIRQVEIGLVERDLG